MNKLNEQITNEVAGDTIVLDPKDVEVVDSKSAKVDDKSAFTNAGGVGVKTGDVAAKVSVGTGDIHKSQTEGSGNNITGSTVNITSNTDNTKNNKASRFNNLPKLPSMPTKSLETSMEK